MKFCVRCKSNPVIAEDGEGDISYFCVDCLNEKAADQKKSEPMRWGEKLREIRQQLLISRGGKVKDEHRL